jgi:putative phosphoribosyl transferase
MSGIKTTGEECQVTLTAGKVILEGSLCITRNSREIIVFAHGSGSSRFSPRNNFVARELRKSGLSTLLFDLLTKEEEEIDEVSGKLRFDIRLLAERLIGATDWLRKQAETGKLSIGYFGASTGAAAALIAAAERPDSTSAVVSRGGRPDMAGEALPRVKAPTLLIVGGDDDQVIELNLEAMARLAAKKKLVVVPGATHLFEEPGAIEEVARLAADWFKAHLPEK